MGLSIESNNKNGLFGQLGQNNSKIARLTSFLILLKNNLIWSLLPFWFVSLQKHHLSTYFINFIFYLLISFKLFFFFATIRAYSLSLHDFISKCELKLSFFLISWTFVIFLIYFIFKKFFVIS